ncbi:MAG TPA: amino acid permease [Pirellulales bacterium]|nr:amino acid permease [Pirellulales bacterium]
MTLSNPRLAETPTARGEPERRLSLFDATSMIVGIIIGSGLYQTTPMIAANMPSLVWLIGGWLLGAMFSLVGSLCYAELATTYPADGGDYVYLSRAFGRAVGFMFAWAQLWVIRPGSIGAMTYVFGRYATQLAPLGNYSFTIYAAGAVLVISGINILGVRAGKWTQNALTAAKLLGLATVIVVGLTRHDPGALPDPPPAPLADYKLGLALILIVFTYGGWNDIAYAAAEVRDPQRNILRALMLGVLAVATVYVGVNLAFVHAMGLRGFAASNAIAADVAALGLGDWGRRGISILICISTLGAINGMIFTGARIYYAMGRDHTLFAVVGRWSQRFGTPAWSLTIQAACTLLAVVGFGMTGEGPEGSGFQQLIDFTTPVFWFFLLLTGVSLLLLRLHDGARPRPFRVPGYPLVPLVFCGGAAAIVFAGVQHAIEARSWAAAWAAGLMAPGVILAFLSRPKP